MSLEMHLFVERIDDSIIPRWIERMNSFDMNCEIHPGFSFSEHSGFLPFKIKLNRPDHPKLLDKYYITGFEFYLHDFDLEIELQKLKSEQGLFRRLFGQKKGEVYFAGPEIDAKLKSCKKMMRFVWGVADTFEFRMANLSSAILADLTSGVSRYAEDDVWYENSTIVHNAVKDVADYESSVKPEAFSLHEFERWL